LPLKKVKFRDAVKVVGNAACGKQKIHQAIGIGIAERLKKNRIHD